jgi:predicted transcriptional regulator
MLEDFPALSTRVEQGTLTCHDLVKCIFNLNRTETTILRALPVNEQVTPNHMAGLIRKDRSTVYRGLEKLVSLGLALKERRGGESRGFSNVYQRVPEKELYRKAEKSLDECYLKIKSILKEEGS